MNDPSAPATRTPPRARVLLTSTLLIGLVSHLTLRLPDVTDIAESVWWPAAGVALALVLRQRSSRLPVGAGICLGTALGAATAGLAPTAAVAHALATTVQSLVAGEVVVRTRGRSQLLHQGRDIWLLGFAAVLGVSCGTAVLAVLLPTVPSSANALTHLLGLAVVTPLVLLAGTAGARSALHSRAGLPLRRATTRHAEGTAAVLACAATAAAVFWSHGSTPWAFLVVGPVLWAAARTGPVHALVGLLFIAVIACTGTRAGLGPYGGLPVDQAVPVLQALLCTATTVALATSLVVRARDRAVETARERETLFRRTFDDALLGVALLRLGPDGRAVVERVNERLTAVLGGADRVVAGSDWADQVWPGHRGTFVRAVRALALGRERSWHGELRHGDGDTWLELAIATWPAPGGDDTALAAVVQVIDCTQRRAAERRLRDAAMHDHLTGLPNRVLLEDRLRHALNAANRSGRHVALLYCDLDDFKPVNDTGGHAAGDQVLIETAGRLGSAVRPGDTVARMGGDEFVVVCPDLPDEAAAYTVAQRIVEVMRAPFEVVGWRFEVGVSIGIVIAERTSEAQRMLQSADEAMYRAKRSGKGRVRQGEPRVLGLRPGEQRSGT